ncbi:MAG: LysM peptidoglycan-binding domain-containing protein [Actinomycetaceae bacterium]|nr:LysM peptidoglycan-binding domain-containing protein [Actinomycetaceae bacterium]
MSALPLAPQSVVAAQDLQSSLVSSVSVAVAAARGAAVVAKLRWLRTLIAVVFVIAAGTCVGLAFPEGEYTGNTQTYIVAAGEDLWSIANLVRPGDNPADTVEQIKQLNHLHNSTLQIGQHLQVPVP